jgi:hypothetical protein
MFIAVTVGALYMPPEYQYILPLTTMPMMIYSRMAQIISNVKHGTTGQLSLITTFLQLGGSLARVFTTIMEVGWDMALLAVCGLSTALAGILMAQVMLRSSILQYATIIMWRFVLFCLIFVVSADYLLQLHQEGREGHGGRGQEEEGGLIRPATVTGATTTMRGLLLQAQVCCFSVPCR